MGERELHHEQVRKLLAQDPKINDTQLKEIRMQIEQSLEMSEAKAKQTRHRILVALAIYFGGIFLFFFYVSFWRSATPHRTESFVQDLIPLLLYVSWLAAIVIGLLLAVLYVFKYSPRLNRARFDLQTSILLELQQQVKRLRESVEHRK
jgi:hypothetical protein